MADKDKKNKDAGDHESEDGKAGKNQQKEFFREEIKRLRSGMEREKTKISEPELKEYTPYTFNNLEPYFNVKPAEFVLDLPDEVRHGYTSRPTAIGLCDPWVDHTMDVTMTPRKSSRAVGDNLDTSKTSESDTSTSKKKEERPPKEGSTRLPKFPAVSMVKDESLQRDLFYNDVPTLREELTKKLAMGAETKVEQEYVRTKQDFYRMELDKMNEYHPISRPNMRAAYFAYLQNTPGAKKAIYECVKSSEKITGH